MSVSGNPTSPAARRREQIEAVEHLHPYTAVVAGYHYDGQQLIAQIVFGYDQAAVSALVLQVE